MRPLLDDAVAIAGQPDVVLMIDEAPVDDAWHRGRVAERMDEVAGQIEYQH